MKPIQLILPLERKVAETLTKPEQAEQLLKEISLPELISVLILLQLPSLKESAGDIAAVAERVLSTLLESTRTPEEIDQLRQAVFARWSRQTFREGYERLADVRIDLLNDAEATSQSFLTQEGGWDYAFSSKLTEQRNPIKVNISTPGGVPLSLTDPQARAFQKVISEPDESIHLQGYAGGGKTHLARAIVSLLPAASTVVIAQSKPQLQALLERLGNPEVQGLTFAALAAQVLVEDQRVTQGSPGKRSYANYQVSDESVAMVLGINAVSTLSPAAVAKVCRRTVMSYCNTGDRDISIRHLPTLTDHLTLTDKEVLVEYSRRLWRETIDPEHPHIKLPIRGYHQIKYLSLTDLIIPEYLSHILVDEAHDLTIPMLQILDRSPQAVITLGDRYQRLTGVTPERNQRIRRAEINLTVRAGKDVETILNPLIETHPVGFTMPLIGSAHLQTKVRYYDRPGLPTTPTTILTGDNWSLFEWYQRLTHAQASFALLPGAKNEFIGFVKGCLSLYHDNIRSSHPFLFRYPSWEVLARAEANNPAFKRIEALFAKGYGYTHFERAIAELKEPKGVRILLGRVDDARNMEFTSVTLSPELLPPVDVRDVTAVATTLSRLYVGGSRAKSELIVPGHLQGWIQDLARAQTDTGNKG